MKTEKWRRAIALALSLSMLASPGMNLMPTAAAEEAVPQAAQPASDLMLELNFDDESVKDSSGNEHPSTPVGTMTYTTGYNGTGKALHLDNSAAVDSSAAQYVVMDDLSLGTADFSVMFWYKAEPDNYETVLFSNKDWKSGANPGLVFADMRDGTAMNVAFPGESRVEIRVRNDTSMTDGGWHHFAGTFDRDGDEVYYIDGKPAGSKSIAKFAGKTIDVEGQPYCLGADGLKNYGAYTGDIDEFRIYSRVLTAEEVKTAATPEDPSPTATPEVPVDPTPTTTPEVPVDPNALKLLMDISFDDGTADDAERGIKGTLVGAPEFVDGKVGKCIHITNPKGVAGAGTTAEKYIKYGNQLQLGKNDFSISFWYKAECRGDSDKEGVIFANKDWKSGNNPGLVFADMRQGLVMNVHSKPGDRHEIRLWSPEGLTDGEWHHIAGTFDRDGNEILYADGKELGRKDISNIKDQSMDIANREYNIGADGLGRYGLEDGYIDEFCVYEGIISPEDLADVHLDRDLAALVEKCRKLAADSAVSQEEKDAFTAAINDIENRGKLATTPAEFKALIAELEAARKEFLEGDEPLACFDVMSDTHITNANNSSGNYQGMHRAIQNILKHYPDTMGIFNCGDYTNNGYEDQNRNFFGILNEYKDQVEFTNCLGNHDVRWKPWTEIYERYMRYNAEYMPKEYVEQGKVYHDKWLGPDKDGNGRGDYHFIVMNSEYRTKDKAYYSDEQLKWFREKLAEENEDGSKPVFVFTHAPLKDTIHWSNHWSLGEQDGEIKEIMRDYPNTVLFTGHVHNGIDLLRTEQRDWGYAVDIPGFISCDQGRPRGQYGWHVKIFEDRLILELYDYINDTFVSDMQQVLWIPNQMAKTNGKILDVDFNDGTANDRSGFGNNGTIHGDVEFVEGPFGDKAVHLVNKSGSPAQQFIDFGDLNLGKENFTTMFWYKADSAMTPETVMFSNKNWKNGANDGLVFADMTNGILFNMACEGSGRFETDRFPQATDGEWHLITVTVDRDGYDHSVDDNTHDYSPEAVEKLYIDGHLVCEKNIDAVRDKSVESGLPYVLGADGLKNYGITDGYFDGLKVYKTAMNAAEIRTLVSPFTVEEGKTSAVLNFKPERLDNRSESITMTVAYLYLDDESTPVDENRKIPGYPAGESIEINDLKPNTPYHLRVVTVEKKSEKNITDVYDLHFTTEKDIETFTVVFKDFDGTQIGEAQTVNINEAAKAPADPTREGYTFVGWDKDFSKVTSDMVVTAKYEPIICNVTVDGEKKTVQYGQKLGDLLPKDPVREGYTFDKWLDADGNTITADTVVKTDLIITSQWIKDSVPTPDVTPSPDVTPTPDVTPKPEPTPAPEVTPKPEPTSAPAVTPVPPANNSGANAPQTGDSTNLMLWAMLAMISGGAVLVIYKKSKQK